MNCATATIYRYRIPLVRPLQLKGQTISERTGFIVALRAPGGEMGYGEIAPLPGFSVESEEEAVRQAIEVAPAIVKRGLPSTRLRFTGLRHRDPFHPSVRFGLESALLSMQAAVMKVLPARLLGESPRETVPLSALMTGDEDRAPEVATARARQGYRAVKLKVGRNTLEGDIELVRAVRKALPSSVALRLDANQAWTFDQALQFAKGVDDCALDYIEEPLADPGQLTLFHRATGAAYAVDESLRQAGWRLVWESRQRGRGALEAADPSHRILVEGILGAAAWVVKPTLLGLPLEFFASEAPVTGFDGRIVVSSSFESGVGLVTLANLAAAGSVGETPAGLDTQGWFLRDPLGNPLPVEGGCVSLAQANRLLDGLDCRALEVVAHV